MCGQRRHRVLDIVHADVRLKIFGQESTALLGSSYDLAVSECWTSDAGTESMSKIRHLVMAQHKTARKTVYGRSEIAQRVTENCRWSYKKWAPWSLDAPHGPSHPTSQKADVGSLGPEMRTTVHYLCVARMTLCVGTRPLYLSERSFN